MNGLNLRLALATLMGIGSGNTPAPDERPRYPFVMGEKYDARRKSPSHTKKGPGRRHVSGRNRGGAA